MGSWGNQVQGDRGDGGDGEFLPYLPHPPHQHAPLSTSFPYRAANLCAILSAIAPGFDPLSGTSSRRTG